MRSFRLALVLLLAFILAAAGDDINSKLEEFINDQLNEKSSLLKATSLENDEKAQELRRLYKKIFRSNKLRAGQKNDTDEKESDKAFYESLSAIVENEKLRAKGKSTFKMGLNKFSDIPKEKFDDYTGLIPEKVPKKKLQANQYDRYRPRNLRRSIDWRERGGVTPVKSQGGCRSCYAFAFTGAAEGRYKIQSQYQLNLSEQHIVDCSPNMKCGGGWFSVTAQFVKDHGYVQQHIYPYRGQSGYCYVDDRYTVLRVKSYRFLQDETEIMDALNRGPIPAGMHANSYSFKNYIGGIYANRECDGNHIDHAILLVGYGTENGENYWIGKNSWGEDWGENGFFRIRRGNNFCGLETYAVEVEVTR